MASRNYSVSSAKILDNRVGVTPGTRTGRQRNPERGLPSVDALRELARTYLQTQAALWPDLVRNGTIPELFDEVLDKLASDFKRQFLDAGVKEAIHLHASLPSAKFASSYLRYSCDHSNPRSLDQQLRLQLEKARQNNHFIPWRLVFADAAVSGTTADRSGYILAKKALRIAGMETMYIDEIGRASRDAIESLPGPAHTNMLTP